VKTEIAALSLEEKIGQMFMCGFHGTVPTEEIRAMIREFRIGGIIYFRRNVRDVEQVAALSRALQRYNAEQSGIPLLIATDQEGGMVARIDREVTLAPGAMALGAAGSASSVSAIAEISGRELRAMGVNMNFAPSLDVNNNPRNPVIGVRSYGEDPAAAGELGAAAIRGYQRAGVAATAKHFPGHGDTEVDSHLGLPLVPHGITRLEAVELLPFIRAIEEGVDAIMTAHVIFPAFESGRLPATLSYPVLTGLLRNRLGYGGVIVTDCLEMNAVSKEAGIPQGAVLAVEAGADLVLVSHTFEEQKAAVRAVTEAVRSGRIPESRIDESAARILALKGKRQMDRFENGAGEPFCLSRDWEVVRDASERSITLVKDEDQLPLDPREETLVVWAEPRERTEMVEVIPQEMTLGAALSQYLTKVEEIKIGLHPSAEEIGRVLDAGRSYKQIVIATHNAFSRLDEGQVRIVKELAARPDVKLVVASTRNPYDLNEFQEVKTYLCVYENRPVAMESLAKVLTGGKRAKGRLPVSISELYPAGSGLVPE
jgi:beta-N-acetylhexosaminidase